MKKNQANLIDNFLINTAKKVGKEILYFKNKNLIKITKKQKNLKTNIDVIANKIWISNIKKNFNNVSILSEELKFYKKIGEEWTGFIIDPIDGTRSLFSNYNSYVTQVAFINRGKITSSIIYNPETKEIFTKKTKIYKNSRKLNSIIDNYSKPNKNLIKIIKKLKIANYFEAGSIGYKISKVLDNTSTLFIKLNKIKLWDVAPGIFLIKKNGGFIVDKYFKEINLNQINVKGLIVTMNKESLKFIKKKYPKGLLINQ